MIYDCFVFFDELDILELRLRILADTVDRFVLCEAPHTFRGRPKPLTFAANRERFARWNDRIVHLVHDGAPDADPWANEVAQRNALARAVAGVDADALVLLSDVDEIPAPANVAIRPTPGHVLGHGQRFCSGFFNRVREGTWVGTRAFARRDLGARTMHEIRSLDRRELEVVTGGWHLCALGGAERNAVKLRSYAHAELDIPYYTDALRLRLAFDSTEGGFDWRPLDATYPDAFREPRWSPYVWSPPPPPAVAVDALLHAHGCFAYVAAEAAAIAVLASGAPDAWETAGRERFGGRYAGAFTEVAAALDAAGRDGCVVVDQAPRLAPSELRGLATSVRSAVAFASHAGSVTALIGAIEGRPFPPGAAVRIDIFEDRLRAAGWRIARRDDTRQPLFHHALLAATAPFPFKIGPVRFPSVVGADLVALSTLGHVLALVADPASVTTGADAASATRPVEAVTVIGPYERRSLLQMLPPDATVSVVTTNRAAYADVADAHPRLHVVDLDREPATPVATDTAAIVIEGLSDVPDPTAVLRALRERAPSAVLYALVPNAAFASALTAVFLGEPGSRAHPLVEAEFAPLFAAGGWQVEQVHTVTPQPAPDLPFELQTGAITYLVDTPDAVRRLMTPGFLVVARAR